LSLAAHIDGVIVLVREKKTAAKDIDALRHRLDQVGVPIVGGVLISRRRRGRGRRRRHIGRPRTAASQPVIERAQLSAQVLADEPEAAAPRTSVPMPPASEDDTIMLRAAPGDSAMPPASEDDTIMLRAAGDS
jgi:hypothetical protein